MARYKSFSEDNDNLSKIPFSDNIVTYDVAINPNEILKLIHTYNYKYKIVINKYYNDNNSNKDILTRYIIYNDTTCLEATKKLLQDKQITENQDTQLMNDILLKAKYNANKWNIFYSFVLVPPLISTVSLCGYFTYICLF
jgi:hypothetical protein